jgi:hypothetical protein
MKVHCFGANLSLAVMLCATNALASVMAVGPGAFPGTSLSTTFTGLADGTEVNGLSVNGLGFSYSLGNGNVIIDGGPGATNNISPPNIVSIGNPAGSLSILLPFAATMFGYGYAILATVAVPGATTISIFNGATFLGSLSYNGLPDPTFTGGFAGLASTLAFDRVVLTFNSGAAPAFALDNILVSAAAVTVPEPAPILLFAVGLLAVLWIRSRRVTVR